MTFNGAPDAGRIGALGAAPLRAGASTHSLTQLSTERKRRSVASGLGFQGFI